MLREGRQSFLGDFPDPFVCRRCGESTLGEPPRVCPTCGAWGSTFQRFRPVYWLSEYDPFEVARHLRSTPGLFEELLQGVDEETLTVAPQGGGWSIHQVIRHVRDAEGVLHTRVALILEEENPPLESKAVWSWADAGGEEQASTREILQAYEASREETLSMLEGIPLESWWRTGRHQEWGEVTLLEQASYFAAHELTHLRQIS